MSKGQVLFCTAHGEEVMVGPDPTTGGQMVAECPIGGFTCESTWELRREA